ncbi:hypothetical protein FGK63_12815 [Ruegeria sediminis]|uniref:Lipoprotein n=1 Tax=Ruegeria sediminis TaxID=2583820 RepID=A0ABY2WX29_9RHOB|nr:hypothetical protein [Ruegeria sediminis]TMV06992.1 hypothetical protein FGK63_12815 [Ruegeria sediminis]
MPLKSILAVFLLVVWVSGCGDTTGEQILYGAGAGAAGSAILDTNIVAGAAVGAAANVIYCEENPHKC